MNHIFGIWFAPLTHDDLVGSSARDYLAMSEKELEAKRQKDALGAVNAADQAQARAAAFIRDMAKKK